MKFSHLSAPYFPRARAQAMLAVCLLMLLMPVYGAAQEALGVPSYSPGAKESARAPRENLPIATKVARGEAPLSKLYSDIKLDASAFYRLPQLKASEMEDSGSTKLMRIGATRSLARTLTPLSDARRFIVPEGEVSLLGIVSEQALQVRVHFTGVNLAKGARLFVYSASNPDEVYGAFEGRGALDDGEFWTPPVRGDNVVVEYFEPSTASKSHSSPPFKIEKIMHIYKGLDGTSVYTEKAAGACHLNVTSEWSTVAKSVGRMQFVRGGGSFLCTGTLLNNQASDGTPNFLTANHCINTASEAQSLRVTWNYNTPGATSSFTDGSTLLATGTPSDFTLVRLTGNLPNGLIFSGWSTTVPSASTPITGIHHPTGDYKRISFGNTRSGGCPSGLSSCLPVGWNSGTTEGGSSGSGIWTGSPTDARLVGTLNGGAASCDNLSGSDYYGRFDTTYAAISSFLDGTGTPPPPPSRPANDNFADATVISGNASSIAGSNTGANKESGEPNHAENTGGASVWYRWQATASGTATLTTANSSYDTLLAVYTGTSVNALNAIISNDDETQGVLTSRVTFNAVAGTTYYIAVDGFRGAKGSIALAWNFPASAAASVLTEVKAWTVEGKSQGYVRLTFPDASYRLAAPGTVARNGNDFAVSANIDQTSGATSSATATTAAIYDLGTALAPGTYTFSFTSNRSIVQRATFTVGAPSPNTIDDASTFARQHYRDFLSREPDSGGLSFWTNEITVCGNNLQCIDRKRVNTSGSFFLSQEFQATGYYIYRMYKGAFGRAPYYAEFIPDVAQVSQGIVVNNRLSPDVINSNKAAFAVGFVQRAEFLQTYNTLTSAQFVDRLFQTTGIQPTAAERSALITELDSGSGTLTTRRARVLARITDGIRATPPANGGVEVDQIFETRYGRAFYDAEYNRAFVQMQYFGYLRRDPDQGGYDFWLAKLNRFGNYLDAEMVRSFILAAEYRARFGQP